MTSPDPYADFRLNLEQQKKRAKELLRAAKAGDDPALQRLATHVPADKTRPLTLASAQHTLARELRFANWAALKQHITAMEMQRQLLDSNREALDGDERTMHIRCGHDIQETLLSAGLRGDFNLHINPYLQGPVTADANWLEQRARFICEGYGDDMQLEYANVLQGCRDEETRLLSASNGDYERVVMWFEHDCYDQFILARCLAFFAEHRAPPLLELVDINDFPGSQRFLGLGQLPPEALRLLWQRRQRVNNAQIETGRNVWQALRESDPRSLAYLMHEGTRALPHLAAAVRRHLQELPGLRDGLGLNQRMLLTTLARLGPLKVARLIGEVFRTRDSLSGLGDTGLDYELLQMEQAQPPVLLRKHHGQMRLDEIALTDIGREMVEGRRHWLDLQVPPRWVGGVLIQPGKTNWYWDDQKERTTLETRSLYSPGIQR